MQDGEDSMLEIRRLKIRDLPAFLSLRARIEEKSPYMPAGDGETRERMFYRILRMVLHRDKTVTFVAYKGKVLIGYITLVFGRFAKFRGNAYIASVSVRRDARGQGIGTRLLEVAEEHAKSRGARRLELEVFSKNKRAFDLYMKLGWEVEGKKRKAVENLDGFDDLVFMAKFL